LCLAGAAWDSPKAEKPEEEEEGRAWLAFGAALTAAAWSHGTILWAAVPQDATEELSTHDDSLLVCIIKQNASVILTDQKHSAGDKQSQTTMLVTSSRIKLLMHTELCGIMIGTWQQAQCRGSRLAVMLLHC